MDTGLRGKVAMVAAGSKGIGLACAQALALEGCRVSICSRTEENLARACELISGTVRGYRCDVASAKDLERWVDATGSELGPPEIVVTNTGGPPAANALRATDEQWLSGFESTLMNVVRLVRLTAPMMQDRGWGRFVHLTSLVAKEPNEVLAISSTLRAGLMALTRLQASALASDRITVNSVLPGHTMTDRQVHLAEIRSESLGVSVDEALVMQARQIPVGRLGKPEEIASAVVWLCSEQASFVTGVNLLVDGGGVRGLG